MSNRLFLLTFALLLLWGCSTESTPKTELTILAASSLTDLLTAYEADYEQTYTDIDIRLSFTGSQQIEQQLKQGFPADLVAPAHPDYLTQINRNTITPFAKNQLTFVTYTDSNIQTIAELLEQGQLGIGVADVPIGRYSRQWLEQLDLTEQYLTQVVTEEVNVRQLATKIALGELNGGIVYASDVTDQLRPLSAPLPYIGDEIVYVMGITEQAKYPTESQQFLTYLTSPAAEQILRDKQFIPYE